MAGSSNERITNGTTIRAYDPATGERLWVLGPNSELAIVTPIVSEDIIYLTAGYPPVRPVYAVRPGHRGDLSLIDGATSSDAVAWSTNRGRTYIPASIVYRGHLYTNANNGRLTSYDARTGEIVCRRRIGGGERLLFLLSHRGGRQALFHERGGRHLRREGRPRV